MEVELYVYDLSQGLARQWSMPLTGTQIDAIYHTSLVFGGVEYFFGSGVQRKVPGTTHHGRPMQTIKQGETQIPQQVIEEYMESLAQIYTAESYDLFLHNCNNFTQDLSMFLTGREIPAHIRDLPQKVLDTPFGKMLRPQIDQAMRGITQGGEDAMPAKPMTVQPARKAGGPSEDARAHTNGHTIETGKVHIVTTLAEVSNLLEKALSSCAVIFFTSSTCSPCKIVYPTFDSLAKEAGSKCTLIKIDLNYPERDLVETYNVHVTPTFMTFLKGEKENEWSGADPSKLNDNVKLLIQMAWPEHPHKGMYLPTFSQPNSEYALFTKTPPIDKLLSKVPEAIRSKAPFKSLVDFVRSRSTSSAAEAHIPNLQAFSDMIHSLELSPDATATFAIVDLLRVAFVDPRISGFFASQPNHTLLMKLIPTNTAIPHNLHVVSLQLLCNTFSSPLYHPLLTAPGPLNEQILTLAKSSLLGSRSTIRHLAAALIYNMGLYNHKARIEAKPEALAEGEQVELIAALVEAIKKEGESAEAMNGMLRALGILVCLVQTDGEVVQVLRVLDTSEVIRLKGKEKAFERERLIDEVAKMTQKLGA